MPFLMWTSWPRTSREVLEARRPRADHEQRWVRRASTESCSRTWRLASGAIEANRYGSAGSTELPLFPLNTVLFPGGPLPLRIFEPRYVDMIRKCMREGAPFGVLLIRSGKEVGEVSSAADIGTSARIVDFNQMPDGLLGIICTGEQKFRLDERRVQADGLNVGTVTWLPPEPPTPLPPQHSHLGLLLEARATADQRHLSVDREAVR